MSDDALAQAVSKRLRDFTELKTKVQALELAMAVVRIFTLPDLAVCCWTRLEVWSDVAPDPE
jgi:hypothetical protein